MVTIQFAAYVGLGSHFATFREMGPRMLIAWMSVEDKPCFGVWPKHNHCYLGSLKEESYV